MKRILAICLCFCMVFASFTGVAYAADTMQVTLSSDRYGHIYTEIGQTFKLNVKNTLSTDFNGKIVYDVLSNGSSIYSEAEEVNISAGGTYSNFTAIAFPKYGIFELKATVTDGTTVYGTDTIPFSFINGSKDGEGSKKMYVNTHIEESYRNNAEEIVNAVRDAGFGGLRSPVYWFQVEEHNKNEYKMPAFTENIKDAAKMGMEPLVVLSGGNGPWGVTNEAEGNLNMAPDTDTERQAFANYCAYVATNLKGYVKHYEIWNEFTMPSNGGDQSSGNYAKLLIAASKAIKAADPDAKIIAMCTAGVGWSFISGVVSSLRSAGESNCYDILSVHPYSYGTSYEDPNTTYSSLALVKSLAGSKPIWFTERGWDTSTTVSSSTNGISDYKQAVYGVKDYLDMINRGSCERFFWYDFQDDGIDAAEREDNFGLIEAVEAPVPGAAKPAYVAFAAMNKLLGQATYKQRNSYGSDGWLYSFTDSEGKNLFVLSGSVGNNVTIMTGAGKYELLDMYSNVVAVYDCTATGNIRCTQTDEIMYVRRHYEPAGCTVSVSGDKLLVKGHSIESNQQVSILVSSAQGDFIYAGQTTCNDERAYSFTADRKGINELYVKVNYGELYNGGIETGIVLKLMCDDKRIFSVEEITSTENLNLVISVNDDITTSTDIRVATYDKGKLHSYNSITLDPGTAKGDYSLTIKVENSNFDNISGFVWENLIPVMGKIEFK